ncbi:hypothetical protein DVH24_032707 [Malus domestica]|uniref:Uncharacterized protein n=1 Tax=Malus domestica TaxID=3750 RepID=A0A498J4D1_MALDO|nr:hypothetical protein DVH24_032707 [Malus domestica]
MASFNVPFPKACLAPVTRLGSSAQPQQDLLSFHNCLSRCPIPSLRQANDSRCELEQPANKEELLRSTIVLSVKDSPTLKLVSIGNVYGVVDILRPGLACSARSEDDVDIVSKL